MTKTFKTNGLMIATGLATLALMQPAMALDAQAFVDRIESVYKVMGYEFDFGSVKSKGNVITVDGVAIGITGLGEQPYQFDSVLTFTGVAEYEDGSFSAEALTIPDIDTEFAADPVGHISLTNILVEDLWLPPEGDTSAVALLQLVARASTGPLVVTRDGVEVIRVDGMETNSSFAYDENEVLEEIIATVAIGNVWVDLSSLAEEQPEAGAIIEALGLTTINANFTQAMTWTMEDGHLNITESLLDVADVGALNFLLDFSGFTPAVLDKIYSMQASGLDPLSEEAQAQQMMVGMELAQAMILNGVTIRYDDASLAGNLLDFFASQSGAGRADFVAGLKAMLPGLVSQSGVPALADVVVPPVSAFLDNPQSLEVKVAPPSPASFLVLAAAAANPAGLIKALGLTVTANQ